MNAQLPKLIMVEYKGRQLPFLNNLASLRNLSIDTGIPTISGLEKAINHARQNSDEIKGIELLGKNFYYALKEGHRVSKIPFDMEPEDMLDSELHLAIAEAVNKNFGIANYSSTDTVKEEEGNAQTQPS